MDCIKIELGFHIIGIVGLALNGVADWFFTESSDLFLVSKSLPRYNIILVFAAESSFI
jgi:hypothetical protein